ncbi:class I adenylate-forming enzyme family protein [Pseudonocardia endophytica]|uniref:Fatty-acyl-CoA synthase/long-chain acyl-CoA synthetase n=1 Tax=Pseudonocardia endophytica TaxID=401976 RepID=A0A4R1HQX7_PSEEN|nr:AMP-binding protein [Pseudonocardia endophytica]TCK24538.1 fatty-acyl-CoA synthase/long-chain acyl-CoA synthetase [Pseudonocardia endophytica]
MTTTTRSRSEWTAERTPEIAEETVGAVLRRQAADRPDTTALVATRHDGTSGRWTYAELLDAAERAAGGLLELAEPGERVALWAPNVAEWPIVQYGAALAGMVLVAPNPALRPPELEHALRLSGATVLVHADRVGGYDMAAVAAEVTPALPGLRHVRSLSEPLDGAPPAPEERSRPDDPAMIQFTSGTTGHPKGVLLAHRSLVNNARFTMLAAEIGDAPVAIAPLPMFHTAGCVISTLGPAFLGGTMVLIERFEPVAVLETMRAEGATVLMSVPTVLGALVATAGKQDGPAPQLETVLVGAATAPGPMIEAAHATFGAHVHNLYGQTELSPVLCLTRRTDSHADLTTSVGRPLPHTDARVVDPATREVVALGEVGEVCARGYNQMIHYVDDPEATAAGVDRDGFLHTGDLGSMDERGMITLTGRLKELIIRGGENVSPAEVEIALAAHPAVAESAVLGLPDEQWGEIVAAAVRTHEPAPDGLDEELAAHCMSRLTPSKVPVRWFFVDDLPHTPSGKVQKYVLREQLIP